MKKLLSLLLVVLMLTSGCLFFTSCDELDLADVAEDPLAALELAEKNALDRFFTEEYGIGEIAQKALENGSTTLAFSSELPLTGAYDLDGFSATMYTAGKKKNAALRLALEAEGKRYFLDSHIDESGVILDSEDLFGTNGPLKIVFDTFVEKVKGSALAQLMELDGQTLAEFENAFDEIRSSMEMGDPFEHSTEELEKLTDEVASLMKQTVTEDTVGEAECAVITYSLDSKSLVAVVEKVMTFAKAPKTEVDALIANLTAETEGLDLSLTASAYISFEDAYLVRQTAQASCADQKGNKIFDVSLTTSYTDTAITTYVSIDGMDLEIPSSFALKVAKTVEDAVTTYTLTVKEDEKTEDTLASYSYNEKTGSFTLKLNVEDTVMKVKGVITASKDEAKLAITEFGAEGVTVELELSLTFKVGDTIPAVSGTPKDVTELTQAELNHIASHIENSPLFKILEELGSTPEFE